MKLKNIFYKEEVRKDFLTKEEYTIKKPNTTGIVLFFTSVCIALILLFSCFTSVPTGHTGVVTTFGKVSNHTLDSGFHLKAPWQKIIHMDNRIQKETLELSCFSSDLQEVNMVYTVNYEISKTDAMTIYSTIGESYYNTVIIPNITESVKTSVAKYTAENLISNRNELSNIIHEDLKERLIKYNIVLVSSSVEDTDFTEVFTSAVEAKQVAEQNKLKAQTEAEQQIIEAEAAATIKTVEATADADAKKIAADAKAYEIQVQAEAEAEANKKLAASITDELIDYKYTETWNGELPTYMGGNDTVPVLDLTTKN